MYSLFSLCLFCVLFLILLFLFFFFKQKTAYEMRISDWSSDVCSSDLFRPEQGQKTIVGEQILDRLDNEEKAGLREIRFLHEQTLLFCQIGRASCRERVCQYV